ncbi:MAG: orotidine-5'-phosphate decarboxylase [Clostridia bacterium]|nr:orotidine-5'-phosphate decarboxylase [Clostridia bacterium]
MNAMERLNELVKEKGVLLAGLDPDVDKILSMNEETVKFSRSSLNAYELVGDYCYNYIQTVKDEVAAIKINIAFFEAYGMVPLFWEVAQYAQDAGLFVIGDIKRADIGNTSKQYAEAFLQKDSPIDAITINPYFGTDGVKPFLDVAKENGKGVFVLVKTSNKSSSEIQDLELKDGKLVYQKVAELVKEWGQYVKESDDEEYSLVGAVVGATHPAEAKLLRETMPNTFFLVPGYGAQGATADDIVVNFDDNGGGAIVNSSRGLMFAYEKEGIIVDKWHEASKRAAIRARKELSGAVSSYLKNKGL